MEEEEIEMHDVKKSPLNASATRKIKKSPKLPKNKEQQDEEIQENPIPFERSPSFKTTFEEGCKFLIHLMCYD